MASCCVSASMTELKYKVTFRFVDTDAPRESLAGPDTPAASRRDVGLGEVHGQPQRDHPVLRPGEVALVDELVAVHVTASGVVLVDDVPQLDVQGEVVIEERMEPGGHGAGQLAARDDAGLDRH